MIENVVSLLIERKISTMISQKQQTNKQTNINKCWFLMHNLHININKNVNKIFVQFYYSCKIPNFATQSQTMRVVYQELQLN